MGLAAELLYFRRDNKQWYFPYLLRFCSRHGGCLCRLAAGRGHVAGLCTSRRCPRYTGSPAEAGQARLGLDHIVFAAALVKPKIRKRLCVFGLKRQKDRRIGGGQLNAAAVELDRHGHWIALGISDRCVFGACFFAETLV